MSELRDRIAGLQRFHIPVDYAGYIECSCGTECKPDHGGIDVAEQMWGEHVADAVIAELKQQWRADLGYDGYSNCESRDEAKELVDDFNDALGGDVRDGEQAMVMRRWVTEWEVDE